MRFRKLRARMAGELKKRADRTKSRAVSENLYKILSRMWELERKAPPNAAFVPFSQLSEEAQRAAKNLSSNWIVHAGFGEVIFGGVAVIASTLTVSSGVKTHSLLLSAIGAGLVVKAL